MEILELKQIQDWDKYTIEKEPIESIDLMERASRVFTRWLLDQLNSGEESALIVVSKGNNGGDGLAIGRMLVDYGLKVKVLVCNIQKSASADFQENFERLRFKNIEIVEINNGDKLPSFSGYDIIIDGIFGSGLSKPVEGYWGDLIRAINKSNTKIYSIDIPSGMYGDRATRENAAVIHAYNCLSFECPKLSFFFPSNSKRLKNWAFRSIGLHQEYLNQIHTSFNLLVPRLLSQVLRSRNKFDHKGKFGKGLLIAGKKGMIGAALLSTRAMLRSGIGLCYCIVPDCGYKILQGAAPEAMVLHGYGTEKITALPELNDFDALGAGPGIGTDEETVAVLDTIIKTWNKEMVIDADALNIISQNKELLDILPPHSILTPHPGEFERLFGSANDDFERLVILKENALKYKLNIVLKGAHTVIANPEGQLFFNDTGNPGMATGGSGDVLTGIITGLFAQGYKAFDAAVLGVHIHGMAGDYAANEKSEESMIASDIIENLGKAFNKLNQYRKTD